MLLPNGRRQEIESGFYNEVGVRSDESKQATESDWKRQLPLPLRSTSETNIRGHLS
jgi:hypothetical protein